jgi:hypothetical protein
MFPARWALLLAASCTPRDHEFTLDAQPPKGKPSLQVTLAEFASVYERTTGRRVRYPTAPAIRIRIFGDPGTEEVWNEIRFGIDSCLGVTGEEIDGLTLYEFMTPRLGITGSTTPHARMFCPEAPNIDILVENPSALR